MPKQRKKARGSTAKARDSTATTRSTRRSRPKRSNSSPNQPLTVQNDVLPLTTQNEAQRVPSANEIASSIIPQLRGATDVGQLPASTSLQEVINLVPGPTANIPSSSTVAAANPESLGKESRMTGQESEAENQQLDLSYLTVKQKFKDKSSSHQGSLKIVVLIKWGITVISFVIFLASLVVSKLTLFGLVNGLKAGKDATVLNYQTYCMCFVLLLAPNIISLLRSLWNITGWFDLPWPGLKAVGLVRLIPTIVLIEVYETVLNFTETALHVANDIGV